MKKLFEKYELELSQAELEKFELFLKIFMEKNSQINLSAIREKNDIVEKHFIDSIILNIFVDLEGKVADLGTGGGFPLIPLAIVNNNPPSLPGRGLGGGIEFTGIDSVGKKLKCVDEFAKVLGLDNVKTINGRAEDLGKNLEYRESFDFVVSRATAYFPTLLEYTIPLLKVGGIFIAYKLDDKEELKSAKKALIKLGSKILKVKNYTIAGQKRTFVFIEKVSPTHKKYPRRVGEPLGNPIK